MQINQGQTYASNTIENSKAIYEIVLWNHGCTPMYAGESGRNGGLYAEN